MNGEPEEATLKVVQVSRVGTGDPQTPPWLIDRLWGSQAVGVIGGAPKSCKSWLALEMALSVASGRPCLGCFEAIDTGAVLVYAAEDSPRQVRARLEGLARARQADFEDLAVHLILEPKLRLDVPQDQERLAAALRAHRPRLLVLDPFVRLHRADENSAAEVSALLADLRGWQREFGVAIVLVHHTRKSNGDAGGQALRGSSDLHAWGDSNLYLRRNGEDLVLSMEHRWARSGEPLTLTLAEENGSPPHLVIRRTSDSPADAAPEAPDLATRVLAFLRGRAMPATQDEIRDALKVRTQRVVEVLWRLRTDGKVIRTNHGWTSPANR
jgi:hypothetical protein